MISQAIVALIGTISFSVLFSVPVSEYLYCGLAGMIGWLCYLGGLGLGLGYAKAIFIGALVLTIFCRFLAVKRKLPLTVFLICGIFPLVPGAGIYYTAYYFITNQHALALTKGLETFSTAVMIALGIVFALAIPHTLFKRTK